MRILVIAATHMEISLFRQQFPLVEVLIAGVGSPATIYHLLKKVSASGFDLVIQAGIAGMFPESGLDLSDTVLVRSDIFADLGIEEKKNFSTLSDMGFTDANAFPYKNGMLVNENKWLDSFEIKKVAAVTVNKITDDPFQIELFGNKYRPQAESMEGAAFHLVCLSESIPFLQLRSISNLVGERDKTRWKMKEAVVKLNAALGNIIEHLQNN